MKFYEPGSDFYYIESSYWAEERAYLLSEGCVLLKVEDANKFNLSNFFIRSLDDIKPRLNTSFKFFILPYELEDDIQEDLKVDEILFQIVLDNLRGDIFIASTDRDKCCFIKCRKFNEDIIYTLYHTHINTPFIVFDNSQSIFLLVDFDLPLQILGYKDSILDSKAYISNDIGDKGWDTVFKRYSNYRNLENIFKDYYQGVLPKKIGEYLNDNR